MLCHEDCERWSGVTSMASGKCECIGCSLLVPVWLLTTTERWWRLKLLHNHSLTLRLLTDIYGMRLKMSRWSMQRDRLLSPSDPGGVSARGGASVCAHVRRGRGHSGHTCVRSDRTLFLDSISQPISRTSMKWYQVNDETTGGTAQSRH